MGYIHFFRKTLNFEGAFANNKKGTVNPSLFAYAGYLNNERLWRAFLN